MGYDDYSPWNYGRQIATIPAMSNKEEFNTFFGEILRDFRKQKRTSQEQLAFDAGLDRTYISLLERGLRQPSLRSLFSISKALSIDPHIFVVSLETKLKERDATEGESH